MTAFKLQGVVIGVFLIVFGITLFFWKGLDELFANEERSKKSIKATRIGYGIVFIIGGILSILTALLDWKVAGSIIPRGY